MVLSNERQVIRSTTLALHTRELSGLVNAAEELSKAEDAYRRRVLQLRSELARLETQVATIRRVEDELLSDYGYAATELPADHVECPTCGAEYANLPESRFGIADANARAVFLAAEVLEEIRRVRSELDDAQKDLSSVREKAAPIKSMLSAKRQEATLGDVVREHGRRDLLAVLTQDEADLVGKRRAASESVRLAQSTLRRYSEERAALAREHLERVKRCLRELDVRTHAVSTRPGHVTTVVRETGSDLPRSVLAQHFALIASASRGGRSAAPIVVDSPNQQDQDSANFERIFEFMRTNRPEKAQLIVGTVSVPPTIGPARIVELTSKRSVLDPAEFDGVNARFINLTRQLL